MIMKSKWKTSAITFCSALVLLFLFVLASYLKARGWYEGYLLEHNEYENLDYEYHSARIKRSDRLPFFYWEFCEQNSQQEKQWAHIAPWGDWYITDADK